MKPDGQPNRLPMLFRTINCCLSLHLATDSRVIVRRAKPDVAIPQGFLFPSYQGIPTGLTALGMTENLVNNHFSHEGGSTLLQFGNAVRFSIHIVKESALAVFYTGKKTAKAHILHLKAVCLVYSLPLNAECLVKC